MHTKQRVIVAPSLLGADFSNLAAAVAEIEAAGAEWVHFDVTDNRFVPNLTFGPKLISDLRPQSNAVFDIHLMVTHPEQLLEVFIASGADNISFHFEVTAHVHKFLEVIQHAHKKAGISIVPSTPVFMLEPSLPFVDLVLVMTVDPGFGGQHLIPECLEKVRSLAELRAKYHFNFLIAVDGGINESNAGHARSLGADVLVTGSAFFNAPDKAALVQQFRGNITIKS
ncbi:MAG: ribulose-phosphate 3-epimerase [Treponema sp.]|jgi:ribulose-phosphate 3-epimerase|nr:ribulose-phosphate 3-epimerase [Treponema sp.]